MPQISGPNLQENQILKAIEVVILNTGNCRAERMEKSEHRTRLMAPWTDSRPHPRIVDQLAGENRYQIKL
jgi:hypothetical protein